MRHRNLVLWSLALTMALSACGGSPPAPKPVAIPPQRPAPVAVASAVKPVPNLANPQAAALSSQSMAQALTTARVRYEPKGRRDPFENIEARLQDAPAGLSVTATKLTAIVRGAITLALVEDAKGVGYILKPGDTLGDGRVVEIGVDSIVFAVAPKPGSTTNRVVLRMQTD
jgi:Tfp pilus assembly protein PilP